MRTNSELNINPARNHVVTGGTGFVGSALILELLGRTEGFITALVRPKAGVSPSERLHQTLNDLIDGYDLPKSLYDEVATRVRAIEADIEQENCGVVTADINELHGAEFWHCAASLQYQDRHRAQIERTNVYGTENVLALAQDSACTMFNMVSTAYVAGSRTGNIVAAAPDMSYINNCYERSKIMGEQRVVASGMPTRVLRPSVVVGHSRTHHTISTDGLYGFIRNLTKFRNTLERTQAGLARTLEVSIEVHSEGVIDLVPIDAVVQDAVGLSNAGAEPGYYHLTNPAAPLIGDVADMCFVLSGLAAPKLVRDRSSMSEVDLKLQKRIDFYGSYLINPKRFDRSSVEAVLGASARSGDVIEGETLGAFCNWFLDRLEGKTRRVAVVR